MKKGFTIIELLLAMALLFALLAGSGIVFSEAIKAHRAAKATSEVSMKLRAITGQLEADFRGLRQDGEIAIAWQIDPALSVDVDGSGVVEDDEYVHFDRMMFFADGDFATYNQWYTDNAGTEEILNGNLARVCYMIASGQTGQTVDTLELVPPRENRMLSRSQHLYTAQNIFDADGTAIVFPDPLNFDAGLNNLYEFDLITMSDWGNIAFDPAAVSAKSNMLAEIFAIDLMGAPAGTGAVINKGTYVDAGGDTVGPTGLGMLLSEGVSEFRIQAWNEVEQEWYPKIDDSGRWDFGEDYSDRFVDDTGAAVDPVSGIIAAQKPFALYQPGQSYFAVSGETVADESVGPLALHDVPGFGKALKFTFTIHDENGFFENGKRFSYIVELN